MDSCFICPEVLYRVFVEMGHVSKMITGNLSEAEKLNLLYLLQKLENFHFAHHENKSVSTKADLKTLVQK